MTKCANREDLQMASAPVFFLVHGTWSRFARWTRGGSLLRHAIRDRFGQSVEFRRLSWSGKNTHAARREAAERLADDLESCRRDRLDSPIVLIGHSHGGNVIIYAAARKSVREEISALVCLATPFFRP